MFLIVSCIFFPLKQYIYLLSYTGVLWVHLCSACAKDNLKAIIHSLYCLLINPVQRSKNRSLHLTGVPLILSFIVCRCVDAQNDVQGLLLSGHRQRNKRNVTQTQTTRKISSQQVRQEIKDKLRW